MNLVTKTKIWTIGIVTSLVVVAPSIITGTVDTIHSIIWTIL